MQAAVPRAAAPVRASSSGWRRTKRTGGGSGSSAGPDPPAPATAPGRGSGVFSGEPWGPEIDRLGLRSTGLVWGPSLTGLVRGPRLTGLA